MQTKDSFFRTNIDAMEGYTPGEQPKTANLLKLNTNENPFPPSPKVIDCYRAFDISKLRLYPDPVGCELRDAIAAIHQIGRDNILLGNGSDDILTIVFRSFAGEGDSVACLDPTYSLYPVLAQIQNVECRKIPLADGFSLPEDLLAQAEGARLLIIARPNAPIGNAFPLTAMKRVCEGFSGVVLIDEAYVEFADDNCVDFVKTFENVVVCRTLSKSYSLAGVRLGYAMAAESLITGMMKVKDSYNVNALTLALARAAVMDQAYLRKTVQAIIDARTYLTTELETLGFTVIPSQANFIFASPPAGNANEYFDYLRKHSIVIRYFPGETTGSYVRITIGLKADMDRLIEATKGFVS